MAGQGRGDHMVCHMLLLEPVRCRLKTERWISGRAILGGVDKEPVR